ncbi:hypothetical protein H5V45_04255 [Nocardioides sp. KIGAM211]|uniref:Uncharacterized protein n=1 Tax=Nocardioides luti TaxID=2761101 RepID=A0A7X0V9E4_9ACTN|nr:hypothetical protein [Nocardioides luti]MBB6626531.1 hypothetical protein [Nocardioides luti]
MTTSSSRDARGRGRSDRSRPRAVALVPAAVVAALLVGGAVYAGSDDVHAPPRQGNALVADWSARKEGQQVLGGARTPGVPSIQRLRHDRVEFTVTVAPARPGPNLVRVDTTHLGAGHRHRGLPVLVGTTEQTLVRAVPRPGTDGLWAVVDLPEGSGTVLVTHGRYHRVPFAVETGTDRPDTTAWTGPDGPECLAAATAAILGGGSADASCPAATLGPTDATALRSVVDTLATRGVEQLAVQHDASARSRAAYDVVRAAATSRGLDVVEPSVRPGRRSALLVVSGWSDASRSLARVTALPLRQQPMRNDGTWLAPWLLSPAVVDSTLGAVLPLDFDVRDPAAQEFSQTLATYLPGQSPTASGYLAWRSVRGTDPDPLELFAASRTAIMPAQGGHEQHETAVAWFPGGTVTPVGALVPRTGAR